MSLKKEDYKERNQSQMFVKTKLQKWHKAG